MEENKTPQGSNNAEHVIGWLEKLTTLLSKTGLQNIMLTIMVLFLVIVVGHVAYNPEKFIDRIEEVRSKQHAESIVQRLQADPEIYNNLYNILTEANADKVILFEAHNGGSNLSNLPFLYIDLTYCLPKSEMAILEPEYKNVRLSRYPWATLMYNQGYWCGHVSDFMEVDPELFYRLSKDNLVYMGAILIYGNDSLPCGMICICYESEEKIPRETELMKIMHRYSSVLSSLLVPKVK